jgi:hypothetical protein
MRDQDSLVGIATGFYSRREVISGGSSAEYYADLNLFRHFHLSSGQKPSFSGLIEQTFRRIWSFSRYSEENVDLNEETKLSVSALCNFIVLLGLVRIYFTYVEGVSKRAGSEVSV